MSRQRLLSITVVVLVLLNAATLIVLLFRRPPHPPHPGREGPKGMIIERLHFNEEQVAQYEELIRGHRRDIGDLDGRMMDLRRQLYTANGTAQDSLIRLIGNTQSEVERVNTAHFADIKALCRGEQVPLYDALTKDLADHFRHLPRKERP